MFTNYKDFPDNAKVWVFPSQKKIYPNELPEFEKEVTLFLTNWETAHGFETSFKVEYHRFLIIFVNAEKSLSTPIIDELIHFIFQLQTKFDTELMDKMNACFKQGAYVQYKDLIEFKKLIKNKGVNKKTIVFDNTVATKFEFEEFWEVPAADSWYSNLFR